MVTEQIEEYECPYCNCKNESYDAALECAKDCALENMDMPISTSNCYTCEYCGDEFLHREHAVKCEKEHIRVKDKYYDEHHRKVSFAKLAIAANHKQQTKLYS